jgi:hypothetical protein
MENLMFRHFQNSGGSSSLVIPMAIQIFPNVVEITIRGNPESNNPLSQLV